MRARPTCGGPGQEACPIPLMTDDFASRYHISIFVAQESFLSVSLLHIPAPYTVSSLDEASHLGHKGPARRELPT
jgi:hypothetical protein